MRKPVWKVVDKDKKSFFSINIREYTLNYNKGKITKAKENSLGIFCFKTKEFAQDFLNSYLISGKILKVEPIGRGKTQKTIGLIPNTKPREIDLFYKGELTRSDLYNTIKGTVCYPAVKVLE